MKITWKKGLTAVAALSIAAASFGTAYAAEAEITEEPMLIAEEAEVVEINEAPELIAEEEIALLPDQILTSEDTYMKGETLMIPLRRVCEMMMYEVNWTEETSLITITRGVHYITCTPYTDEYTFAKMGPVKLGTDPDLIEGTTYVPVNFLSDVMQKEYTALEDGGVVVKQYDAVAMNGEILTVAEDHITVKTELEPETILFVDENTEITVNGEAAALADLKEGDIIDVTHRMAMTMSIPPQTYAYSINAMRDVAE